LSPYALGSLVLVFEPKYVENGPAFLKTASGGGSVSSWLDFLGALSRPVTVSTAPCSEAGADAVVAGAW